MTCILCQSDVFCSLLEFRNHPAFGQRLLKEEEISQDHGIDFDIIKCEKCGLVQLGNCETFNYYNDDYLSTTGEVYRSYQEKLVQSLIDEYQLSTDKKIIEIGCGEGSFSKILQSKGCSIYAIEPSGKAYKQAKQLGIPVERKYLNEVEEKFDFFVLCQVLEHISNPDEFIQEILKKMHTNFSGIIEVPRLENILDKNRIYEFYPEHIVYYDLPTLSQLLGKYFTVDSISSTFDGQFLSAKVSQKLINLDIYISIRNLSFLIKETCPSKIGMRGAGAKGINLLGLLGNDITQNIVLLDGDSHKVGKYTPATHIKITDKQQVAINDLEIIIISADMYKDEIIKELWETFNYRKDIITISDNIERQHISAFYSSLSSHDGYT